MGNTMKAAVVCELGKPLALREVPLPQPNENQILVRIAATGICHTDFHAAKGDGLNSGYSVNGSFAHGS